MSVAATTSDFYVLLALILLTLTSLCLGDTLIRLLPERTWTDSERVGIAFLSGAGLLSLITFALSLAGLASKAVFIGFSVAVLFAYLSFTPWAKVLKGLFNRTITLRSLLLIAPPAIFILMYVIYAHGPETSPDAMDYHLTFADLYKRTHHFVAIQDSYQAGFPQASEMIFLFCDAIADFRACALSHVLFLTATIPFFLSFGRLIRNTSLGLVAAGLFVMSPIVGIDAATAYNDVALASYALGAAYLLTLWSRDRDTATLVLAGAFSGMAMATKYTGAVAIVGGVVLICFAPRQPVRLRIRRALLFAAICSVPVMPWLVKNAVAYGNPLLPFANAWFPNSYINPAWEIYYKTAMRTFNGVRWAEIPMEVTVRGFRLTGLIGPVFLLFPLFLFTFRMPYARHLFFWIAMWLGAYSANLGTRFLIPVLPFLCLGLASVFTVQPVAAWAILYLHGLLSWPTNIAWYSHQYAYAMDAKAVVRAIVYDTQLDYLSTRETYRAAKLVEANVPSEAVILSFVPMDRAYMDRHVIYINQSAKTQIIQDVLTRGSQKLENAHLLNCRFPEPVGNIEISGKSKGASEEWSVSELTAFDQGGLRKPIGVTSTINPWYLHYLLDGRLVTHWSTWGPVRSINLKIQGSNITNMQLAFVDELTGTDWRVAGTAERAGRKALAAVCTPGNRPVSEDLEQTAIQAVKDLGITHVLLRSDDSYSAFFQPIVQRHGMLIASEGPLLLLALK